MPYETVKVQQTTTKRVRVCARCRSPISEVANRQTIQQVGGVSVSLGASLGGSIVLGSVLGPVGAIGGAIAGSFVGARAGRNVSDKVCEAVESNQDSLCPACRRIVDNSSQSNEFGQSSSSSSFGGGHRLGSGERIGEAASAAGRRLSDGLGWMKTSVSNVIENAKNQGSNNVNGKPPPSSGGAGGTQTSGIL